MSKEFKEIGGYLCLDSYQGNLYYKNAILLNSGRACLVYLIRKRKIRSIWLPAFLCDTVIDVCKKECIEIKFYHIGKDFLPHEIAIKEDEWLYCVNYYGQISNLQLKKICQQYKNIIIDSTQAFFQKPLYGIDTIYSCRKFFGVSDGAFLCSDLKTDDDLEREYSYKRLGYIYSSFEKGTSLFYNNYIKNEENFSELQPMKMSKLTENLLRAVNYTMVKKKRTYNFSTLHNALDKENQLNLKMIQGGYMYPFLIENGSEIRKKLIERKIYIPILWPNVIESRDCTKLERSMAENILPLPIDQRYEETDMQRVIEEVFNLLNR